MHNKIVVVTGTNGGVGFVTAKQLADAGAEIVMVCRDPRRGETAQARIAESATGPPPQLFIADLSSQGEIHDVARDIHLANNRIDVLLNNAGSVFNKGERSIDGIEKTFATNHLAPFLLTNLLQDLLLAAAAARVVTVASEIYSRKFDFANLQGERSYNFFKAYQQSKLCNVLFAYELARRLEDTNVTSNVVSPGPSKTGFGATMTGPARIFTRVMKATPRFGTPEKGARTLVYATTDPELDGVSGHFYYKEKELATKPVTHDTDIAARLWHISEQMCGLGKGSHEDASALSG
ncbi:MAG TPA: SDR family NAD(P)-dependent oxidoreductase [Solirubrobacteraceae bacterium]|nr:SDR family NAD(P)-dependent oxidoreductase [Solirubrobacteraceae bacterium]